MTIAFSLLAFLTAVGGSDSATGSLVQAELAFCSAAATQGTREAFLTYLADDAIVFKPGPRPGRTVYRESKPSTSVLSWYPVKAEVSRAGDLGYTTGPWVFRKKAGDSPAGYGQYVSVWRVQANGRWRVILDVGIQHPQEDTTTAPANFGYSMAGTKATRAPGIDTAAELRSLLEVDRAFSLSSRERGFVSALLLVARNDIRVYRDGGFPVIGLEAVSKESISFGSVSSWDPTGGVVSLSGDIGYTFGKIDSATGEKRMDQQSDYVRIWRRFPEMGWKLALDLVLPPR